jgi:hypothetical protein
MSRVASQPEQADCRLPGNPARPSRTHHSHRTAWFTPVS